MSFNFLWNYSKKNFFLKAHPLSEEKVKLLNEIKDAVANLKLIRAGKQKAKPARELLDKI